MTYKWTDSNGTTDIFKVGFCSSRTRSGEAYFGNALYRFKNAYPNLDAYYGINAVKLSSQTKASFIFEADDTLYGNITTKGSGGTLTIETEQVKFIDPGGSAISISGVFYSSHTAGVTIVNNFPDSYKLLTKVTDASINYYKTNFHSGDLFTLNYICNLDFTNILDYCKRYRINIYVDEASKKLVFTRHLFDDYTITDFTDKIDKSTFEVSPVTFDKKYLLFSYADSDTQIGTSYKNIYKYPYGAKKLSTEYNFNTDSKTFFNKSTETILYSPTYLEWYNISAFTPKLIFWVRNNRYIECRDESGKTKDINGSYFYPVKTKIDKGTGFFVTDDTDKMKLLNKYYYNNYHLTSNSSITDYWTQPELVLQVDGALPKQYFTCLFTKPMKNYVA